MPGLLKGYIDRFAPDENAHDFSFDGWLRVCTNACVLSRLQPLRNDALEQRQVAALESDQPEKAGVAQP